MTAARIRSGVLALALAFVLSAVAAGSARAGEAWTRCSSEPARIAFNVETQGVDCAAAKTLLPKLQRFARVTVVRPRREWKYSMAGGWLCYYQTSSSQLAPDRELSSFDCRTTAGAGKEVRWTDVQAVLPVELLPTKS